MSNLGFVRKFCKNFDPKVYEQILKIEFWTKSNSKPIDKNLFYKNGPKNVLFGASYIQAGWPDWVNFRLFGQIFSKEENVIIYDQIIFLQTHLPCSQAKNPILYVKTYIWSPGANPTTSSYNARVVKIYNATSSLARFEIKKIIFFHFWKTL
jgi:hypothetical protein